MQSLTPLMHPRPEGTDESLTLCPTTAQEY